MEFVARTNVGKFREENQDSVCTFVHAGFVIGIVADGMGGHRGGSTASCSAIACVKAKLLSDLKPEATQEEIASVLKDAYADANAEIFAKANQELKLCGMGTTLTVALLSAQQVMIANIGDSRAYLVDENGIEQVTVDQTLVQRMIDRGEITPEEAKQHPQRHVILEAVGTGETICPDIYIRPIQNEMVLLCSDGLYGEVEDADIHKTIGETDSLDEAADKLITHANVNGGHDNITVVLLKMQQ